MSLQTMPVDTGYNRKEATLVHNEYIEEHDSNGALDINNDSMIVSEVLSEIGWIP